MEKRNIPMVDLMGQYRKIKDQIDKNLIDCIESGRLVNGPIVSDFCNNLSKYLDVKHVIPCANGTDAIQIAFMALDLKPGDEIICPSWTYIATAEAAAILGLKPVMCDVDPNTFNVTAEFIEPLITNKTKALIPVHLYGQSCEMEDIMNLAKKYNLKVIEDNAQAIGSIYTFSNGEKKYTGTMGDIGTTSFYPAKNLGAYGDGGAIFTNNDKLAEKIRMIVNHGENKRYHHKIIGCNSRLDSLQAVILNIKLKYLDNYNSTRIIMADNYNKAFQNINNLQTPIEIDNSTHVYHQYTLKIFDGRRNELKDYLQKNGIPTMIYYPIPLYKQEAFSNYVDDGYYLKNTEELSENVLSLPIHTEIENSYQDFIIEKVLNFFK
ncbi:MAG: DegT/DnrJ/EryC1/StrS family aminotransferase [Pelagibacterales bacterium]|jgi:UDP-2-acetamido-2-deoxy-ribo-hexuluronate aminotransferase|nr:DegT/DnrJ/EryC1/StrS family aminotransferase [Pelagibacterales bacterium]